MSKPNKSRYRLQQVRQVHADAKGGDCFEIAYGDGEGDVLVVPAPGFWPDAAKQAYARGDDVAGCRALVGEDAYERFAAAGGRADDINLAIGAFAEEHGLAPEKSSPSPS